MSISELSETLMQYDSGVMSQEQVSLFFQALLDTGVIHYLAEPYRRTAADLVEMGRCSVPLSEE